MKIGLIYLPHPYLVQPDAQAPLGLMYIGASLLNLGFDVNLYNFSSMLTHKAITDLEEADLYGITVTSMELKQAERFAYLIKEKFPQAKVIIGGPGSISARELLTGSIIDSICVGDGEFIIKEIVEDMMSNKLKSSYFGEPSNIDNIPLPARQLLKKNQGGNIFAYNKNYRNNGSTVLLTSRGCPFKCSFCTAPALNPKMRYRSVENIVKEILHVKTNYGINQFRISDDMFLANSKRVKELCNRLKHLDIVWRISTRVKPFDTEIAKTIVEAGCKEISFGIESFDNHVLSTLRKGTTAEDNYRACIIAKDAGLTVRLLFMIRTPGQTIYTVDKNISWLERTPYDIIACSTFVPIPGSDIWNNPKKYGITILNKDMDDYNFYFFGSTGEIILKDIIKLHGRPIEEVNEETIRFKKYLDNTGKVNKG